MYILFRDRNWKPSDYKKMGIGERMIVHAFAVKEAEDRDRAIKQQNERKKG